ncbi:MAG: ATP-binding protein [Deltaproteobacteria bacterium]|nr:ATP-binding protein [Deltaproteobacteria bacterium]
MYFNPQVKDDRADFFNFEVIQEELKRAIEDKMTPLIAVYGLRRTGKTSLIRVVLNFMGKKFIWIDSRNISSQDDFYKTLSDEIDKLKRFRINQFTLKGVNLSLNFMKKGLDYLNKHKFVLVIDEAQLLKRLHLDNSVAFIYDNFPNIKIVISGSESGMLKTFLGKNNANAPLYGRAVFELQTTRLNKESGFTFLKEGAKQARIDFTDEEILTAIKKLDGIIGWLTKYGWYRLRYSPRESLRKTIEDGSTLAKEEFVKFSSKAEARYKKIMKSIKDGARWEEIKKQTQISDKQLYSMLNRLIDSGFVEKTEGVYTIADPLLEAAL